MSYPGPRHDGRCDGDFVNFRFEPLQPPGLVAIDCERLEDERGFFMETFRLGGFAGAGIPPLVQENHAGSRRHVLRGLHYQLNPAAQGKLVRCIRGRIFDVAVDIRRGSPSFGRWAGLELSEKNQRMLYIPEGFAHGYCTLSERAEVIYKTTAYWSPAHERAIRWDDSALGIRWPVADPILSPKDRSAPPLAEAEINFDF